MTTQDGRGDLIWRRLELGTSNPNAEAARSQSTPATTPTKAPATTRSRRWLYRLLGLMGATLWVYFFLKLFVIDADRILIGTIAPAAIALLDYRFVVTLGAIVVVVLLARRWPFYVAYVLFFPAVVLVKIAIYLVRHRSWALFLGLLQAASSLFADFRYNAVTKSLALIAAIFIVTTSVEWLIWPSGVYIAVLMFWSLWRRVRRLLSAPSFVQMQRRAIRGVMDSAWLGRLTNLSDDLAEGGAEPYSPTERVQVSNTISIAIGVTKALYLWAYQLERYRRRYSPSVVFNMASYTWVFFATVAGFTLLNTALLKVAPEQYSTTGELSPISIVAYSMSTLVFGQAGGIQATGQLAYVLQVAGGVAGIFILTTFLFTLALTFLRERDEVATQALVADLRAEAQQQERRFVDAYAVTVDEGLARLNQLGEATAGIVMYLARAMPAVPGDPEP